MLDTKFGFAQVKQNIAAMKIDLPKVLANQAQNFFAASWKNQGWEGVAWKEVKRRIPGTTEYKYPKKYGTGRRTAAILVSSGKKKGMSGGTLRRAVSNSIRTQTFDSIKLVVDLPYAAIHNDGSPMAHGGNMPKRTFMKQSPTLKIKQVAIIKEFTDKVWK